MDSFDVRAIMAARIEKDSKEGTMRPPDPPPREGVWPIATQYGTEPAKPPPDRPPLPQ